MAEVHGRSSRHRTPWLRSLIAADTCADVRVFVGRRLLPAGPPAEERMGGGEGRERPGLPRIWVDTGPASRVAHAPCQRPDCPDERGPDRVQIGAQFRAQIQVMNPVGHRARDQVARCRTVGSPTDGRSPVHTEAACPAETGRRPAARRVHDAGSATGMATPSGSADASTCYSSANGLDFRSSFRSAKRSSWARCFRTPCAKGWQSSASPPRNIADERARMSEIAFGRTRNRSLLGTLNDFAFMAQSVDARRTEPESPEELMRFLSQTPILPLDGASPIELTRAAFGRRSVP